MHEVLVNRLGGLSLPRKSVVRLTDRPDMTLDVYCGRKTTMQKKKKVHFSKMAGYIWLKFCMKYPISKRYGTNKDPIWNFIWVLYGHPIWDWDGICNTVPCGTHMGKPIWVTIWEPYGSYSGFGPRGLCQPTFVE